MNQLRLPSSFFKTLLGTVIFVILVGVGIAYFKSTSQPKLFPSSTGATVDTVEYQQYANKSEEFVALQQKLPLQSPNFTLDYDYGLNRFTITPNNPNEFNREYFTSWFNEQNYRYLVEDDFVIMQ